MYQNVLFVASLVLASTAQAQSPQRFGAGHPVLGQVHSIGTLVAQGSHRYVGSRVGQTLSHSPQDERGSHDETLTLKLASVVAARTSDTVNGDGTSSVINHAVATAAPSSFRAQIRGAVATIASGDAEFGATPAADRSPAAFVVSLGVGSPRSAILFTRRNGTPLGVGRYRISDRADGAHEILALLLTGSTTNPTGVFRGQSGWLIVTAASDRLLTGRFRVDGVGFLAAEPRREDRRVNLTGSFSATPASSSF